MIRRPPSSPLFPYPTLFRSLHRGHARRGEALDGAAALACEHPEMLEGQGGEIEWPLAHGREFHGDHVDRKSTRLNSSHQIISYAVFCSKKKKYAPASPPHRT